MTRRKMIEACMAVAQRKHPLDLVARVEFMRGQQDASRHDQVVFEAWTNALRITRNGIRVGSIK